MRKILFTLALLAFPATAQAVNVNPGQTVGSDAFGAITGTILAGGQQSQADSLDNTFTGNLRYAVVREAGRGDLLSFVYQLTNTSTATHEISRLTTQNFSLATTDVGFATTLNANAVLPGTPLLTPAPSQAHTAATRSGGSGSVVGFNFSGGANTLTQNETSLILVIRTNRTTYRSGSTFAINGGTLTFNNTFAPTPEPASLALMGSLAGLLGVRRLRRKVTA